MKGYSDTCTCEVCEEPLAAEPDRPPVCVDCAWEMLQVASELEVEGFLNVVQYSAGTCWVTIDKDIGPGIIEAGRYGPYSLGEAYRMARAYSEDGNLKHFK